MALNTLQVSLIFNQSVYFLCSSSSCRHGPCVSVPSPSPQRALAFSTLYDPAKLWTYGLTCLLVARSASRLAALGSYVIFRRVFVEHRDFWTVRRTDDLIKRISVQQDWSDEQKAVSTIF